MPFNEEQGNQISQQFRSAITVRLEEYQRSLFEGLIRQLFAVKNIRNVQLWTRFGAVQRRFIRPGLPELELDTRAFLATKFISLEIAAYPVKVKCFLLPTDNELGQKFFEYINDNYIREYTVRIFMQGSFICIEYAADSDAPVDNEDLDSDEFD